MSERIITLFGEEIVPEQVKAVGKIRAKKKPEEKKSETDEQTNIAPEINNEPGKTEPEAIQVKEKPQAKKEPQKKPEPIQIIETPEINNEPEEIEPEKKNTTAKEKKAENVNLPEDWDGDKQYYSIGEVATLFNVKTSHIRFWTNEFKLKVRTTRKGDRLYTAEQIKELRTIHHLVKERGFTLSGAKAKLKTKNKIDIETIDLKQSLLQLRNKLVIIRNQLT